MVHRTQLEKVLATIVALGDIVAGIGAFVAVIQNHQVGSALWLIATAACLAAAGAFFLLGIYACCHRNPSDSDTNWSGLAKLYYFTTCCCVIFGVIALGAANKNHDFVLIAVGGFFCLVSLIPSAGYYINAPHSSSSSS